MLYIRTRVMIKMFKIFNNSALGLRLDWDIFSIYLEEIFLI